MPKISIIIPIYNSEPFLHQALDSVINQTFKDLEIICVNDCSPDNSLKILEEYASKDNRIKIINNKENYKIGKARNIGLDSASGEYIMFLDPDDWYDLNLCELAYNQITKNQNDFVYFNYYKFYEKSKKQKCNYKKFKILLEQKEQNNICFDNLNIPFNCSAEAWYKIYNHEFLKKNNIKFREKYGFEDTIFYIKNLALAKNISVINKPLYYYRIRKISNSSNYKYVRENPKVWQEALNSLPDNLSPIRYDSIIYRLIFACIYHYERYLKINPNDKEYYFQEMKALFSKIDKNTINRIKKYINYDKFNLILSSKNAKEYHFKLKVLKIKKIFRIEHYDDFIRVRILGFNFKLHTSQKA